MADEQSEPRTGTGPASGTHVSATAIADAVASDSPAGKRKAGNGSAADAAADAGVGTTSPAKTGGTSSAPVAAPPAARPATPSATPTQKTSDKADQTDITGRKGAVKARPAARKASVKTSSPAKRGRTKAAAAAKPKARTAPSPSPRRKAIETTGTTTSTKEPTMPTDTVTDTAQDMASTMQTKFKDAYEKGTEMSGEIVAFQKANAEAAIESSKIMFAGMRDMSQSAMEDSRKAAEQSVEDMKAMAAIKSPTELVQLQGDIARRNFDSAVAYGSRATESWLKLTNDAFAPLTSRMSEAADKMTRVAA